MARSFSDLAQSVRAEQEILEQFGGWEGSPLGAENEPLGDRVQHKRIYKGYLKHEDELVVGIGDDDDFSLDQQGYPLTDAYHFLTGLANLGGRGTLCVTILFIPGEEEVFEE